MIQLHTLGEAVITVGDREVRPTSPTVFAALLYLGVERGQRVPRTALQGLLFPEADERSGSHSLRQLLYKLRQLGAPVQTEGDVVWVDPTDVVDAFADGGVSTNGNGHGPRAFLDGYAPRISEAFDEWLESQRAAAGKTVRRTLLTRMAARRSAADWPGVETIALQILKVDAFNEEATFALAEATALSGAKAEAIRILERYESEVGRSELKLPASVLRRRISERLPERRPQKLDTPFVGREPEAEAMRYAIGHLRQGVAGTVVIVGEPGIGKSRLLEEMSALAMLEGVNVQTVRCQPHHASRPMGVFIELVPALLQCRGALGIAPEMLEHLQLLTSHRDDRANRPTDARDDATRSGILLAAVRDLVDAVSAEAPLLVAVEDSHWADPTSLTELSALVQGAKQRRVLLVHTVRKLEPLNQAGAMSDAVTLLRLKPLVDDSMAALAAHLLPDPLVSGQPTDVRSWCVSTAAGNPLYLQVLCAHYEETKQPFAVPPSMRVGIIRRIEQLPGDCRRLLEFSALLGKHASLDALRTLLELSPIAFLKAIQRLEGEGFIKTRDGAARLSHDLLTECALELVPPLSRHALHACVAANLEARHEAAHDASLLWDCAEHWAASGELAHALEFVRRCSQHASSIGQSPSAILALRSATKLATTTSEQIDLLTDTLVVARAADQWSLVADVGAELKELTGGAHTEHAVWELIAIDGAWRLNRDVGNIVPQLTDCMLGPTDSEHRIEACCLLLRLAHELGDRSMAKRGYDAVAPLLNARSHDYSSRLVPLIYHTSFGSPLEALKVSDALRRDLASFPLEDQLRAARNLCVAWTILGRSEDELSLAREYYEKATKLGLDAWQYGFAHCICYGLTELERFDEAEVWYSQALKIGRSALGAVLDYSHLMCGVELALARNESETAMARIGALGKAGDSLRLQAAIRALEERAKQLDPDYRSSSGVLSELADLLVAMENVPGADSIAIALHEGLTRNGQFTRRDAIMQSYVRGTRRELSQPPRCLRRYQAKDQQ